MIDSTSSSLPTIRLKCPFIKGTDLQIKACQLEYGHQGESLEGLPARIEDKESPIVLGNSLFFKIVPSKTSNRLADFEEVKNTPILSPPKGCKGYYYGKPCLPDFGYEMGQILWISPDALKIYSKEKIIELLPEIFKEIWESKMAYNAWAFLAYSAEAPEFKQIMELNGFFTLITRLSQLNQKYAPLKKGIGYLKKVQEQFLIKKSA